MSDDKIICIVNAPRIEIVLVPENQAQCEGDEVEDDTLLDAYLIMHLPDGTNVNLKLDATPITTTARGCGAGCSARHRMFPELAEPRARREGVRMFGLKGQAAQLTNC